MQMTRTETAARLANLTREYNAARDEVDALPPEGNGFATRDEMRSAVAGLYLAPIVALERKLAGVSCPSRRRVRRTAAVLG